MFGGINPAQMQAMMKKMGIKQEEIDSSKVIIERVDGSKIVIDNPSVTKINMQGNDSWQITGEAREESGDSFSDDDVKAVMEKASVSKENAIKALEENNGDIAEAILSLS